MIERSSLEKDAILNKRGIEAVKVILTTSPGHGDGALIFCFGLDASIDRGYALDWLHRKELESERKRISKDLFDRRLVWASLLAATGAAVISLFAWLFPQTPKKVELLPGFIYSHGKKIEKVNSESLGSNSFGQLMFEVQHPEKFYVGEVLNYEDASCIVTANGNGHFWHKEDTSGGTLFCQVISN